MNALLSHLRPLLPHLEAVWRGLSPLAQAWLVVALLCPVVVWRAFRVR